MKNLDNGLPNQRRNYILLYGYVLGGVEGVFDI